MSKSDAFSWDTRSVRIRTDYGLPFLTTSLLGPVRQRWRRGRLVPSTVRHATVVDELREASAGAAVVPGSIRRVENLYDVEGVAFVWPLLGRLWELDPFEDWEAVARHPDGSLWLLPCRLPGLRYERSGRAGGAVAHIFSTRRPLAKPTYFSPAYAMGCP